MDLLAASAKMIVYEQHLKVFDPLGLQFLAQVCDHHGQNLRPPRWIWFFLVAMGCGASKVAPLELDTQKLTPVVRRHSIGKEPVLCSVVVGRAPTAEVECLRLSYAEKSTEDTKRKPW